MSSTAMDTQEKSVHESPVRGPEERSFRGGVSFFSGSSLCAAAFTDAFLAMEQFSEADKAASVSNASAAAELASGYASSYTSVYGEDAKQLTMQAYETVTSGAASFLQLGGAGVAGWKSRGAQAPVGKMEGLSDEINGLGKDNLVEDEGGDVDERPYHTTGLEAEQQLANTARTQLLNHYRAQIKGGTFNYGKGEVGLDTELDSYDYRENGVPKTGKITLRDVVTSTKRSEFDDLLKGVGRAKKEAISKATHDEGMIQTYSKLFELGGQSAASGFTTYFKTKEADAMTDKGAASATQQYEQSGMQVTQQIQSSIDQNTQSHTQGAQSAIASMIQTRQTDLQG